MKSLVIFDSNFGNTKIIAEAVAQELEAKAVPVSDFDAKELQGIELLVVGSPINGWRPTEKITEFLDSLTAVQLKGVKAAAFDTRMKFFLHGDAAKKMASLLEEAGAEVIAKPEGFYVKGKEGPLFEGESERAADWAKTLKAAFSSQMQA